MNLPPNLLTLELAFFLYFHIGSTYMTYINGQHFFSWLFHGILNLSAGDNDQNLSQHMKGYQKYHKWGVYF